MGKVVKFPKAPKQDLCICAFILYVAEKGTKQQAVDRAVAKLKMILPSDEGVCLVSIGAEKVVTQEA